MKAIDRRAHRTLETMFWAATIIALSALLMGASCQTGTAKDTAFKPYAIAHTSLMLVKSTEADLVCGRPQAPNAPLCVPDAVHGQVLAILKEGFTIDADLGRLIQALPEGVPTTADIGSLLGRLTALIKDVLGLIPQSTQKAALVEKVG